ncbi:hypothetical protein AM588_10011255 [Phytophthora nicotianae]|nr:hypothetical protein AM588_10011255 [Phytophthora nicotianae]
MLEASGVYVQGSKDFGSKRPNPKNQPRFSQRVSVAPVPASPILAFEPSLKTTCIKDTQDFNARRTDKPKELALQGLQLLFHCEYLALVEYVECVVPLVFATYRLILRQLPNAIYYPNDDENWSVASVVNLLVFAMLEVGSFVFLNIFLQRKCAFSPTYQLAFVLETQMCPVQVHLFVALIILLQYELFHLGKQHVHWHCKALTICSGADFSLQFEWLKDT